MQHSAKKIVGLLRERGGISEIDCNVVASQLGVSAQSVRNWIHFLEKNNVISQVYISNGASKKKPFILHESVIRVADLLTEYLKKYKEGAASIHAATFAKTNGLSVTLLGVVLQKFPELGILSVSYGGGGSPIYKLESDSDVWRDIFEPKLKFEFRAEKKKVVADAEEADLVQGNADHSVCEAKYNQALRDKIAAEELAIKFGEQTQAAKAELTKTQEHNKALMSANEELRQKLHAREQEMRFIERANDELATRSDKNQQRLAELKKSVSVV